MTNVLGSLCLQQRLVPVAALVKAGVSRGTRIYGERGGVPRGTTSGLLRAFREQPVGFVLIR